MALVDRPRKHVACWRAVVRDDGAAVFVDLLVGPPIRCSAVCRRSVLQREVASAGSHGDAEKHRARGEARNLAHRRSHAGGVVVAAERAGGVRDANMSTARTARSEPLHPPSLVQKEVPVP